ncbi:MAG: helix-turn-helix domain-containing protein [Burkholderiales bacterium]|jgi:cytoskeleton protein RodZ
MPADDDTPLAATPPTPRDAGAMLAQARESAGLSVDAVAAQLKLAPRQVRALESGDFAALPGRTFVRGFMRNYARFLDVDADKVLAALPDAEADPGLSHPHLANTHRAMGEIPNERARPKSIAGWAIALALAAIIAVAVSYEKLRAPPAAPGASTEAPASAPPAAPRDATPAAPGALPSVDGQQLPNPAAPAPSSPQSSADTPAPVANSDGAATAAPLANAVESRAGDMSAATDGTATLRPAMMQTSAPVPASGSDPASAPGRGAGVDGARTDAAAAPRASTLEIVFRGTSWVDVKDANGTSILTMTGSAGTARALDAAPPIDLVVGNAGEVDVTFRGTHVDLAPHARQNVARLTLR